MFNERPIDNPRMQEALAEIATIFRAYDLVGGVYIADEHEMAFHYALYSTWNAIIPDADLPEVPGAKTLGFRIRAKTAELGVERAQSMMEGTAWTFGAMKNFGLQCVQWADDFLEMLRRAGLTVEYTPFDGKPLPHIQGVKTPPPGRGNPPHRRRR